MFERFTDRGRRVIVLAQEQARELNHDRIGTEHLLAGLAAVDGGIAHQVLTEGGLDLAEIRRKIEKAVGRGPRPITEHIPFTPRTKKVLELVLREALLLGHNYIGTEHILLAIIRLGEGRAAEILTGTGPTSDDGPAMPALAEWRQRVLGQRRGDVPNEVLTEPAEDSAQPVFVSNLLDALVEFSKRTGATWTINYPGGK